MKRALRNTDTSMFIKSDLGETGLIDQAAEFENYQAAFDFCKDNQLGRVELVVRVSEQYEFTVEVPAPGDIIQQNPTLESNVLDDVLETAEPG